jgi:hypothetical protein
MIKNMGKLDRIIRFTLAIIVAILYFTNIISGLVAIILSVIAVAFILTSFLGTCPLYLPFGINTKPKESKK